MSKLCLSCGARCCRYFCFEIDKPETYSDFEDIRWFLLHKAVSVHIDKGDWYISIDNPCQALDEENRCGIYEDRPLICRRYSRGQCELAEGDYGYKAVFKTAEDIERYARKVLGDKAYERARASARARADRKSKAVSRKASRGRKAAGGKR